MGHACTIDQSYTSPPNPIQRTAETLLSQAPAIHSLEARLHNTTKCVTPESLPSDELTPLVSSAPATHTHALRGARGAACLFSDHASSAFWSSGRHLVVSLLLTNEQALAQHAAAMCSIPQHAAALELWTIGGGGGYFLCVAACCIRIASMRLQGSVIILQREHRAVCIGSGVSINTVYLRFDPGFSTVFPSDAPSAYICTRWIPGCTEGPRVPCAQVCELCKCRSKF